MEFYHVIMGTLECQALCLLENNLLNLLVSVYQADTDRRVIRNADLIREKSKLLFVDSGMLGAMKKRNIDWAYHPEKVLNYAKAFSPDKIASLDIPSEPSMLKKIGLDVGQARAVTVKNAVWLANQDIGEAEKVFVIQGYNLEDYERCSEMFLTQGLYDLNPEQNSFGIGSVCMRKPPDLYEVVRFVRSLIPTKFRLHCFGIASPIWVKTLAEFGISSCDSATASIEMAYSRFIDAKGRAHLAGRRNKWQASAMFIYNAFALEHVLDGAMPEPVLFDEYARCQQLNLDI